VTGSMNGRWLQGEHCGEGPAEPKHLG
jgi:hypothetical protein